MSRYEGKPLLRILECYMLSAIGELQESDEQKLQEMSPKLRQVYGVSGTWRKIVAQVMHFPDNIDDEFRKSWFCNRHVAAQNGETLLAEDFARMIVDDNSDESESGQ